MVLYFESKIGIACVKKAGCLILLLQKQNDSGRSSNPHQNDLERELEDSLQRTHSAEERAMRLEETCRDLKQQMCEIIEQHDANKQEAVDR